MTLLSYMLLCKLLASTINLLSPSAAGGQLPEVNWAFRHSTLIFVRHTVSQFVFASKAFVSTQSERDEPLSTAAPPTHLGAGLGYRSVVKAVAQIRSSHRQHGKTSVPILYVHHRAGLDSHHLAFHSVLSTSTGASSACLPLLLLCP